MSIDVNRLNRLRSKILLDLHQDVMHSFRSISLGTKLETAIQFDQNNLCPSFCGVFFLIRKTRVSSLWSRTQCLSAASLKTSVFRRWLRVACFKHWMHMCRRQTASFVSPEISWLKCWNTIWYYDCYDCYDDCIWLLWYITLYDGTIWYYGFWLRILS